MGILDNLEAYINFDKLNSEQAWDKEFSFESKPMPVTDAIGREIFWDDLGRPTNA